MYVVSIADCPFTWYVVDCLCAC